MRFDDSCVLNALRCVKNAFKHIDSNFRLVKRAKHFILSYLMDSSVSNLVSLNIWIRARRRKRLRVLMNQIYQIKRIKKELRAKDEELEKRRIYRKEKLANQMPRLGWIKYQKPDQDLKLSSELTGTLRQLVPEGNVLTDRHEVWNNTKTRLHNK